MKKFVFDNKNLTYKPIKQKHQFLTILKNLTLFLTILFISSIFLSSTSNEDESIKYYKELLTKIETVENNIIYLEKRENEIYRHILEVDKRKIKPTNVPEDLNDKINYLSLKCKEQTQSLKELLKIAKNKKEFLNHIPTLKPVSNFDIINISSDYGMRIHPILKKRIFHYGVDFNIKVNVNVIATADGIIFAIINSKSGYGNRIIIDHLNGYKTMYAHLNGKYNVSVGDKVKKGQLIAKSGNSGMSTGPHLHYEIEKDGKNLNPRLFFVNDFIE